MKDQHIEAKYERLLELTRQVRGWQKEYFKYHVRADLEKAKKWERELDKFIAAEVKEMQSKQNQLF